MYVCICVGQQLVDCLSIKGFIVCHSLVPRRPPPVGGKPENEAN